MSTPSWRVALVVSSFLVAACGSSIVDESDDDGGGGNGAGGAGGNPPGACEAPVSNGKLDLLFVIDNSRLMADKQEVLAWSIPAALAQFTNPRCVDGDGLLVAQPASPDEACPEGSARELPPVRDMRIGVVTSSLGGEGADTCSPGGPGYHPTQNDAGHLIARSSPEQSGNLATYQNLGYLAWDPAAALAPPGEPDAGVLSDTLDAMVRGAGQRGCGFESSLEAWYRFLIESEPYQGVTIDPSTGTAQLVGVDQTLLSQREAFLRPDSTLAVVMLTDENDCSTKAGDFFYIMKQASTGSAMYHLPKPRAACATNPDDPCCRSCGQAPGEGCDSSQDDCDGSPLSLLDDNLNVRCFDTKRRFGIEFLYPPERYSEGLSASTVADRTGVPVPNPLFAGGRQACDVFLTGIVGVPWQDIARRTPAADPDLLQGENVSGVPVGGVQSAAELSANGTWDVILGGPDTAPTDPHMRESIDPRSGLNPITGDQLGPPGGGAFTSQINGHEYSTPQRDDLQYACIFPLPTPRDCSVEEQCLCSFPDNDNPACLEPNGGGYGTTQYYGHAYPAPRQLEVLESLGAQAVVSSICPAQLSDPTQADFGYRPAFAALAEALAKR